MTIPLWQPGTFYNPGATVRPITQPAIATPSIPNAGFESGNIEWTTEAGWTITTEVVSEPPFAGLRYARFSGSGAAEGRIISTTNFPVRVGQKIKASCQVRRQRSSSTGGRVELDWLDSLGALIFSSQGNTIETKGSTTGNWRKSEVEAFAPAGAAFVRVAGFAYRDHGSRDLFLDNFSWDYSYTAEGAGLVFTAVQPDAGYSGSAEPLWPTVNGQQVVDNEVIWEAIEGTRVVWEAHPILVSDYLEPDWPTEIGASVIDNTIIWTAVARRVTDTKCPNTAIVAIAASKVFAGDDDIIPFSATVNPLDWTAEEDAGFLPFGLQNFGANPIAALGLYRSNLAAFNAEGFQMWQVDENPDNMALLDAGPISCVYPRTVLPVMNDLVFLSSVGVRNIGIAGASTNLQVGDFGQPVDSIVVAKILAGEFEPFSLFVPAFGQYWLFFGDEAIVLTVNGKKIMSWSRYTFPEAITDWTLDGNDLILRTENHKIWRVTDEVTDDDHNCPGVPDIDILDPPTETGTLTIWPNVIRFKAARNQQNVLLAPNGYGNSGGVVTPTVPARPMIATQSSSVSGPLQVRFHGTNAADAIISEDVTLAADEAVRYAYGDLEFKTFTGITQLSTNDTDHFFVAGYRMFEPDEDGTELVVNMRGALVIEQSADSAPVTLRGLLSNAGPVTLPESSQVTVMRRVNSGAKNFDVDGAETIALPDGAVGQEVIGAELFDEVTTITASLASSVTVDVGILFTVSVECVGEEIEGLIQWPHLDLNSFGVDKQLIGFDLVATAPEGVSVSIGYDQRDLDARTTDYLMDADSLPGKLVPIVVTAPSFDVRLTFEPGQRWEWNAMCLWVNDRRPGA